MALAADGRRFWRVRRRRPSRGYFGAEMKTLHAQIGELTLEAEFIF
jgi:hypothetical protein